MHIHRRRHDDHKRRRLSELPISRLFPNMITIAGLCCGLSSIRFAMLERWEISVAFILAAALIDGMDGRVARMLGATSTFGAQLDSLSDFVCFGVAPAIVMYMFQLEDVRGIGWAVVLFFAVCTALRLARFNTALFDGDREPWEKNFFTGVPSPAGGILCLLPLIVSFAEPSFILPNAVAIAHMLVVGTLMASRVPTFSGKKLRIKHEWIPQFMLVCSLLVVLFIIEPWLFIMGLSVVYLLSIVVSVAKWRRLKAASNLAKANLHHQD